MATFNVFGIGDDDRAVASELVCAASAAEARMLAEPMFPECALVEVWEASVLIARMRRGKDQPGIG